jgi:hypothetical protein
MKFIEIHLKKYISYRIENTLNLSFEDMSVNLV